MGGSFESGAGDDPNDLFASDEDADDERASNEEDVQLDQTSESETEEQDTSASISTESADREDSGGATDQTEESNAPSSSVMVEVESPRDFDAAHLAREFVPETYDKPHAWALGRDGVNDGRAEKKTFFLQSNVLDLEVACSQEVNNILEGDVPLTDLRELALILAYHQPELLAEAAREWGAESA